MAWNKILITILIILCGVAIEVTSAFLGGSFNNPAYIILCVALLISVICNASLTSTWMGFNDEKEKLQQTISENEKKISTLSLQNNQTGNNFFHVGVRPIVTTGSTLSINKSYEISLYVNAPYAIPRKPDIKLITNKQWRVYCNPSAKAIKAITHNDKFEYSLKGCIDPVIVDNKFYLYKFVASFTEVAENEFTFLIESREYKAQINNSIFVHSA